MEMRRNTAGFTLVELLVGIVCCSVVTLAAMTVMLTGTRIGRAANDTAAGQQTARIVMQLMEKLAGDGSVQGVSVSGDEWALLDADDNALVTYDGYTQQLLGSGGSVLLEGIDTATVDLEPSGLLRLSVELDGVSYATAIWCRTAVDATADERPDSEEKIEEKITDTTSARGQFLSTLAGQYGSTGSILDDTGAPTGETYSLWYCGGTSYFDGWDASTPWCACFLAWAAEECGAIGNADALKKANVDDLAAAFGGLKTSGEPGDYIFFDWDGDGSLDHVGVVLYVSGRTIFTIEGNSGARVAVRSYTAGNGSIAGYGTPRFDEIP